VVDVASDLAALWPFKARGFFYLRKRFAAEYEAIWYLRKDSGVYVN
jgi:hypothetical protein